MPNSKNGDSRDIQTKIIKSIKKFDLNMDGRVVLTEAATGVYAVTAVIAAMAGAKVYALAKESDYGDFSKINSDMQKLIGGFADRSFNSRIKIIKDLSEINDHIDVVTNSGFVRPINEKLMDLLTKDSAISLMYEPWEFRESDIDLKQAVAKGIKVYGVNEHDQRLRTMEYIGFIALYLLLEQKITPFSNKKILVLGGSKFSDPVNKILMQNEYNVDVVSRYETATDITKYDVVILVENEDAQLLVGDEGAYISSGELMGNHLMIHICGNVDVNNVKCALIPASPKKYGFMSFRTDFIDSMALVDLQTAGLAVGEGMIKANCLGLKGFQYKKFMETNYPALAFEFEKYW
ncbi:hypothetical protein [Bdellovibrio sp. HCB288]|uniref:hypothetical protein n=1 Tax=Bdellovibrio sp. HCB288 TaxID=3394355 RepID=UPI0039B6B632